MPKKINSLKQILARARLDAKRAVKPVTQAKAKTFTDNPDWQAQYLAEFNQFYKDKISTQNDTERKNDSIKKQQLIVEAAKANAGYRAKVGVVVSNDDIENEAQKYGEDATIYIQHYKDEYQRIWDGTTPEEQIRAKAKINGAQAAHKSCFIDEERLVNSAKKYGELAESYIQAYKDAYHGIFDDMTHEEKVKAKAKAHGEHVARKINPIDEEHLVNSAKQHGEFAELYIQTYKDAYHSVLDKMTPEQKVKVKAKKKGAGTAYQAGSIDEAQLERSAKQYDEFAELYMQTYKDAYHLVSNHMTPEQKVITKAKNNGFHLAYKGYDSIDEKRLATTATQYGEFAEIYVENYKNSHKTFINKKRPLPENAKKIAPSKRARLS